MYIETKDYENMNLLGELLEKVNLSETLLMENRLYQSVLSVKLTDTYFNLTLGEETISALKGTLELMKANDIEFILIN